MGTRRSEAKLKPDDLTLADTAWHSLSAVPCHIHAAQRQASRYSGIWSRLVALTTRRSLGCSPPARLRGSSLRSSPSRSRPGAVRLRLQLPRRSPTPRLLGALPGASSAVGCGVGPAPATNETLGKPTYPTGFFASQVPVEGPIRCPSVSGSVSSGACTVAVQCPGIGPYPSVPRHPSVQRSDCYTVITILP